METPAKAKKFGREFKEFLIKGNAIALATGVVIGGAFQAVVNSLVNDILMPIVGLFTAGVDFSQAFIDLTRLRNPEYEVFTTAELAQEAGHIVITYGTLITAIINFLIIGFVIFLLVKSISSADNAVKKVCRKGNPIPQPPPTTKECPFCITEISIKASRCPHCTSEQEAEESNDA